LKSGKKNAKTAKEPKNKILCHEIEPNSFFSFDFTSYPYANSSKQGQLLTNIFMFEGL
jgi:hypothetical protein